MPSNFRETTLAVWGVSYTVRTEMEGRVQTEAQLEAAHTRNVKAKLTEAYGTKKAAKAAAVRRAAKKKPTGAIWNGYRYIYHEKEGEKEARRIERRAFTAPVNRYAGMRRPLPKVTYTFPEIPESVREFYEEIPPQEIVIREKEPVMARREIRIRTCDACAKKGVEKEAAGLINIMGDEYDMCDEHGERFRGYFADLLKSTPDTAAA
ncbi:hypothetical protein ACFYW9_19210 [Streptomyces sp. NPDC002698]|uniref:hypothetical protein n=1 Tax=Streptomyces sp. NPDC002698 TaxID=3364660 RepID=UPI00367478CA